MARAIPRSLRAMRVLHVLRRVEKVIFCEGARKGSVGQNSAERKFWEAASHMAYSKSFRVINDHSKSNLKKRLDIIKQHDLHTIIVAWDDDYDNFLNCRESDERAIRTHGYSFENDVLNPETLRGLARKKGLHFSEGCLVSGCSKTHCDFRADLKKLGIVDFRSQNQSRHAPAIDLRDWIATLVISLCPSVDKRKLRILANAKGVSIPNELTLNGTM